MKTFRISTADWCLLAVLGGLLAAAGYMGVTSAQGSSGEPNRYGGFVPPACAFGYLYSAEKRSCSPQDFTVQAGDTLYGFAGKLGDETRWNELCGVEDYDTFVDITPPYKLDPYHLSPGINVRVCPEGIPARPVASHAATTTTPRARMLGGRFIFSNN